MTAGLSNADREELAGALLDAARQIGIGDFESEDGPAVVELIAPTVAALIARERKSARGQALDEAADDIADMADRFAEASELAGTPEARKRHRLRAAGLRAATRCVNRLRDQST